MDLSFNKLTFIPDGGRQQLFQLKNASFVGNAWMCACEHEWWLRWMSESGVSCVK